MYFLSFLLSNEVFVYSFIYYPFVLKHTYFLPLVAAITLDWNLLSVRKRAIALERGNFLSKRI